MRRFVLVALCLVACAVPNPVFGVDDSGTLATTRTPAETTTEAASSTTAPPTTGHAETAAEATTAGVADTGTSTLEVTSTTSTTASTTAPDSDTSADTGTTSPDPDTGLTLPDLECVHVQGLLPGRTVKRDGMPMQCAESKYVFRGPISYDSGVIELSDLKGCGDDPAPDPNVYELGSGWEPGINIESTCVYATVYWDQAMLPACEIGALSVQAYEDDVPGAFLMFAAFHPTVNQTKLMPKLVPHTPCMCPDDLPNCCGDTPPGDYKLGVLDQVDVPPGQIADFTLDAVAMKFHNLGSYIDESCKPHTDWLAYRSL